MMCGVMPGWESVRGSGDVVEETREVRGLEEVRGVSNATIGDLYIEIGEETSLRIEAEDNLLDHIETEVRGDVLHIETERGVNLRPRDAIEFYLTIPSLESLSVSGTGSAEAPDLESKRFSATVSGTGDVQIESLDVNTAELEITGTGDVEIDRLQGARLEVKISGTGKVTIEEGRVERQEVDLSGSGRYEASDLESEHTNVDVSGSGSATIWATETLDAEISGSGDVRYRGDPDVQSDTSGSGEIKPLDD
jgi:hypothetical protein